ncbi:PsbP domain-containing protein 3, chloroplastic [Chytridiales sp. JEL 0842]|nr:PsbP domain-containing protein 3, chloroplastic [Chytridiales sp. JEL 0842]
MGEDEEVGEFLVPAPMEITAEDRERAEHAKVIANKHFANKEYSLAIDKYTEAISFDPRNPAYYSNRALAYIRSEFYGAAITDAETAILIDPKYVKAYYRRAVGHMAMGKLKDAVKDFRAVVKVAPKDADARTKLSECEKELKRREFEKAISFEDSKKSAVQLLGDVDSIVVEASYDGPHLSPDGITKEFVESLLDHMKAQKKLHRKYTLQIMLAVKALFESDPSLVDIPVPEGSKLTVCGDIHGQYYDLLNIFQLNGLPSETNMYLFNGDFVDRGSFSVECILTLFAYKMLYPKAMYLSRGNHETDDMNKVYGFEGEVKAKYSDLTFKLFSEIFNAIPLGNLIGNKILVVHGGLFSRDDVTLDEIRAIDRYRQPGNEGLMCELLWSDPKFLPGRARSKRGVGIQFGPDVTKTFCENNNLDCIIRSHEVKQDGYEIAHDGKCITIFSAPNYCDSVGNKGAFINIGPDLKLKYTQFSAVEHPSNVKAMQKMEVHRKVLEKAAELDNPEEREAVLMTSSVYSSNKKNNPIASAKKGTGICARGACKNDAVTGGNYCTKHKEEMDENNARAAMKKKTNSIAKLYADADNWRTNHVFLTRKPSPAAGRTFLKRLIRATAAGETLPIESSDDVHGEFTVEEDEEFDEWFLANVDDIRALETRLPMKFTASDSINGGCHMFSGNRRFPALAADAVGQAWEGKTWSWNRFANKIYTTPEAEDFLVEIAAASIPEIRIPSTWNPASEPLPAIPLQNHDFDDEAELEAWLDVHMDKIVDGVLVRGLWWQNENSNRKTRRPVTITREQLKAIWTANGGSWCRYFGVKGSWVAGSRFLLTFDKIDVSRGYEFGNLLICLDRANDARYVYPVTDFLTWRDAVMKLPWTE